MKRLLVGIVILVSVIAVLLILLSYKRDSSGEVSSGSVAVVPSKSRENTRPAAPVAYLEPTERGPGAKTVVGEPGGAPFTLLGRGTTGRIVDRNGEILLRSGPEIMLIGIELSPDESLVLARGGDSVNYVINPATGKKILLPTYPPGTGMLGFGDWHWVGNDVILGVSGVQASDAHGAEISCCDGHNVAQSKLYLFDVGSEELSELPIPKGVDRSVVTVVEARPDGYVNLAHDDPKGGRSENLGWFKITRP
jgi:hypothetical protein